MLGFFLVCFLFCFFYAEGIFSWLMHPLMKALQKYHLSPEVIYTAPYDVLTTYGEIAVWGALFLSIPYGEWHVWRFLSPGLLQKEKKFCRTLLLIVPIFFTLGSLFCYFFVLPLTYDFLIHFSMSSTFPIIRFLPTVKQGLATTIQLIFFFGLCFQLPLFMVILAHIGLGSAVLFAQKRRFVVVGIFILAALLTPPDVLSQIMLAFPLLALYELSILFVKMKEKKTHARH